MEKLSKSVELLGRPSERLRTTTDGLLKYWKVLVVAIVCQLSFALTFQSIPPILGSMISDLNLTHSQGGLLMSLFALPGIVVAIPGGMISDRFGIRKVGVTSSILMSVGILLVSLSFDFLSVAVGRIVSGIGAVTLSIISAQLLSRRLKGRELGLGMGVFNSIMPLGTIISFNATSIIRVGWRAFILLTSIAGVAACLALLLLLIEPKAAPESKSGSNNLEISRTWRSIWFVCLAGMWFNAALISFLTFAQDYFGFKGYEIASAAFLSSIVMMGPLFLSPAVGYFLAKYGIEERGMIVGGAGLSIMIILVSTVQPVILVLLPITVFVALTPPSIFSMPSKRVEARNLGLAFGMITTCFNVGALAGPYVVGLSRDVTGDYAFGFLLLSSFSMMETLTIVFASLLNHRTRAQKAIERTSIKIPRG